MTKKIVSIFTIVAFCVFSFSCMKTVSEVRKVPKRASLIGERTYVYSVQTKQGRQIDFTDDAPGYLEQNVIEGYQKAQILIEKNQIREITKQKDSNYIIITHEGKQYRGHLTSESKYLCQEYISIPFSEIDLIWVKRLIEVKKIDYLKTIVTAGLIVIVVVVAASTSEGGWGAPTGSSCPLIYSFDGENYVFDAEPYGGAYSQGLQRTDWCELENLAEVDGRYSILVRNDLDETQYTDELKLLSVDHPLGTKIAPDSSGKFHTLRELVPPKTAFDKNGRDLLPYVSEKDRILWMSREEDKSNENIKEELVFEFPKPEKARKAKLVVNACSTQWGSEAVIRFLELYGDEIDKHFEDVDRHGPAYYSNINMNLREEMYGLHIRVETEKGWKSKGIIRGGNPLISEDIVYSLDIGDVPGDTVRVKLTPPAYFWNINYLALDYSENLPVTVSELEASEAVDHAGLDVREFVEKRDGRYHIMPEIGNSIRMVFDSFPKAVGMERTVFLKADGYYDIHLQSDGEPQFELIDRLQNEPGFALEHAYEEYFKWKQDLLQKAKQR